MVRVTNSTASPGLGSRKFSSIISSSGIAGPGGGSPKKPVGLVYIGCAFGDNECKVLELHLKGNRTEVRKAATEKALELLSDCLHEIEESN